ncbi:hypothetical protein QZH41_011693 [Actinostola sp. cb2023]|nr:hypothetical protein QZH41_011693 [Actinostola sp. cb2023]
MGTSPSNFCVEETTIQQYSYATLLEKEESVTESLRLFRVTSLRYEAVLNRIDQNPKCLSLFRMNDEKAAREKFKHLYKIVSPFYKTSIKCFNAGTMQELIDTMEQHPEWCLADIAKYLDLRECLSHERIASSTTDKAANPLQVAYKTGKLDITGRTCIKLNWQILDIIQSLTSINAG